MKGVDYELTKLMNKENYKKFREDPKTRVLSEKIKQDDVITKEVVLQVFIDK